MKISRLITLCTLAFVLLVASFGQALASGNVSSVEAGNLFLNPTFAGAEDTIPPAEWSLYGQLDAKRRISLIDADDPAKRALLIEDLIAERSPAGEIGLYQTVEAGVGKYRTTMKARGIAGASGRVNLQLRFLPSNQFEWLTIETGNISKTAFESFSVEGTAPAGTTGVRVYVLTWQQDMPALAIQSISLVQLDGGTAVGKVLTPGANALTAVSSVAGNMVENPTFADADRAMPPTGWSIYGTLGQNTIKLVNADNPEERALHIADMVAVGGAPGEIGLVQRYIPAEPNQAYRLSAFVKAVPGTTTDGAFFQLRFLPSGERKDIPLGNLSTTDFKELVIEGVSPADTESIAIYLHTLGARTPQFLVREVILVPVGPEKPEVPTADVPVMINFENDKADALPHNWVWVSQKNGALGGVDPQVAHSGQKSLQLTGTEVGTVSRVGSNPIPNFVPEVGQQYLVKAWVRSEDLAADVWLKVTAIQRQPTKVLDDFFLRPQNDTHDWYLVQGITPPVPEGTAELWLNINVSGTGTLWVDDFSIEPWEGDAGAIDALAANISSLPQVPQLAADHASLHPRILVGPDDVAALRAVRRTIPYTTLFSQVLPAAEAAFLMPLPPEPEPYPAGYEINHWRAMRKVAYQVHDNLEALAFAYLITGQDRYAQEAKRWIEQVCSWDVNGTTSSAYHDDLGRLLLSSMSLAVDWIYDTLTPEELGVIRPVLLARGRELFRVQVQKLADDPYESHAISSLTYITRAALVLPDIPEAQRWLEFTAQFFQEIYPPWGGDDGGWSEGMNYWSASMALALDAAEMLKAAGVADLYTKEWYQHVGYFPLYFQPPGTTYMNVFGDGSNGRVYNDLVYTHAIRLAAVMEDPYLKRYAQRLSGNFSSPMLAYLFFYRYGDSYRELEQIDLSQLPRSRVFHDIGWVALHSDLTKAADDVNLYFKSSPAGSFSHSHSDQNAFTLTAWNTPFVISSGYYDYYGSPHHNQFTRQTRSKSSILVDGEGQGYRSLDAKGEITEFFTGAGYDLTTGQAAQAYEGKLNDFSREILYCVPDYFVVIDRLQALKPVHFNWLLHSPAQPTLDRTAQTLNIQQDKVGLQVHLLQPAELTFELADKPLTTGDALTVFKGNAVYQDSEQPAQYHFAATTAEAATDGYFVTVLHPYQEDQPDLQFRGSLTGNVYQILATGSDRKDITLLSVNNQVAKLAGAGVEAQARAVSVSWHENNLSKLLLKEGQQVTLADGSAVKATSPVTLSVEYTPKQATLIAEVQEVTTVELPMPQKPAQVQINGANYAAFQWAAGQLTLQLPAGAVTAQFGF